MDLETKIMIYQLFMLAAGILIGWYLTYQHYDTENEKREAVDTYKENQRFLSKIPKTYDEQQRDALSELQRFCDSYEVHDGDATWIYKHSDEQ